MLKSYHQYARAKISAVETPGARHGNLTFRLPRFSPKTKHSIFIIWLCEIMRKFVG